MKKKALLREFCIACIILLFVIMPLVGGNCAEAAAKAKFNWIMSTWASPRHPIQPVYERTAKAIEKRSGGKIKVTYYPAASFGPAKEHFDMLRTETAQLAQISTSYTPGRFPLDMVSQPGLWYGDYDRSTIMFSKQYEEVPLLKEEMEKSEIKCIFAAALVPYCLYTSRPVKSLDDVKGLRIRCSGGQCKVIQSIGASGVSLPATEMYEGIEKRVIDGTVADSTMAWSWRIHEAAKYVLDIPGSTLATGKFSVFMSLKAYNSLPKDLRDAIDSVAEDSIGWAQEAMNNARNTAVEEMKKTGAEIFIVPEKGRPEWRALIAGGQALLIKENQAKGVPMKEVTKQMLDFHKKYGLRIPEYEELVK
jgi:TRAP-type C4-dicarboxylate transport system substrate-binding protein